MITERYRFADKTVTVTSLYPAVHEYCKAYRTDGTPDFAVTVTQDDIAFERQKTVSEYLCEKRRVPDFPDPELETTAVYRKIAEKLPDYGSFVFHGSAVAADGQGFLFTAKSGTGKSTHTALWRKLLGERAVMVNDDKPVLQVSDSGVTVYGTPYNGKHRLGTDIAVPLKALCILTRGAENSIERISAQQAYPMLLQQVYRPQNPLQMMKTLKLIDGLAARTALYQLACNMELSAAETAYQAMKG